MLLFFLKKVLFYWYKPKHQLKAYRQILSGFNGGINISDESNSYCFSTSNNAVPFLNAVNNVSTNLKEENLNVENNTDDIIIMKLERLAVLKEKGILSDNEFEIQKKRILEIL